MDSAKQQLAEKLKTASNVLVTVSRDPSVDQLAALIGLSLLINKQGKHCAAVFSGNIPSTLEFLKPEETIEKNTDSLRDFIIALDKNKADKLRYKVEDNIVRIFITPYRTSISQADLEFSQGDFNVDVVVALGVREQADLDEAITAHGRILHDAVVASINASNEGGLGSINWHEPNASSLSELVADLAQTINKDLLDAQIATALLTGIVSETDRFSNDKTSSQTMSISAVLMTAGANQQLVATKLDEPDLPQESSDEAQDNDEDSSSPKSKDDGTLEIDHEAKAEQEKVESKPEAQDDTPAEESIELPEPDDEEPLSDKPDPDEAEQPPSNIKGGTKLVTEPPTLGGTLTANSIQNDIDPVTDPMSLPQSEAPQLLDRKPNMVSEPPLPPADINLPPLDSLSIPSVPTPPVPPPQPQQPSLASSGGLTPPPPSWIPPTNPSAGASTTPQVQIDDGTLTQLEQAVNSPHTSPEPVPDANSAREEVNKALSASSNTGPQPPIEALNAQPLGPELHPEQPPAAVSPTPVSTVTVPDQSDPSAFSVDSTNTVSSADTPQPPPVPPPIPFDFGKASST